MSQAGRFGVTGGGGGGSLDTLTGNSGGAISPDGFGNINLVGNGINVSSAGGGSTITFSVAASSTTVSGIIELATNAETIAGTDTVRAVTPDDLKAKLGAQTQYGVMIGAGTTAALSASGVGLAGQVLQSSGGGGNPDWSTTTYPVTSAQGDLMFAQAANQFITLSKDTNATRYLSNTGTSNNPAWAQVSLSTGITGTLPIAHGGTASTSYSTNYGVLYFDGTQFLTISSTGTAAQVLTSNGVGVAPSWQAGGGGSSFSWNTVSGTSQSMSVNNGYITDNAGLVTCTLPGSASVGDVVRVTGKGAGGWKIAQNAGQTIYFGELSSTTGAGGYLASTLDRDTVELVCVTANNDWNVLSSIGNITVV